MRNFLVYTVVVLLLFCCQSKQKKVALNDQQYADIAVFAENLVSGYNNFDGKFVRNAWNDNGFKKRVGSMSEMEQSVFEHVYETRLQSNLKFSRLSLLNLIRRDSGTMKRQDLQRFEHHTELVLVTSFSEWLTISKYRLELVDGQATVTDYFDFRNGTWLSEEMARLLQLNITYGAFSEERKLANKGLSISEELLNIGDTLGALKALYTIPASHQSGNFVSLKKLRIAKYINDSTYSAILREEAQKNPSLYLRYLYGLAYGDSIFLADLDQDLKFLIDDDSVRKDLFHNRVWR